MFKTIFAATLLVAAGAAQAASYDVVAGFAAPGSPYSFGTGFGASFTASPNFVADGCVGTVGLACYNDPAGDYTFPAVGKNISGADPLSFYTNVLPQNLLFMQSLPGQSATVRFTAPTAGSYDFTGFSQRIDTANGAGDGVTVGVFGPSGSGTVPLGTTYLQQATFSGVITLGAGATVDFYVDANGNTFNDGTGLSLTATAVPEPATWGLMIAGFAMTGFAVRRRARLAAA